MSDLTGMTPGDYLLVTTHDGPDRIVKVERLTATRVVTTSGSQYRKDDGRLIGADVWHPVTVSPTTGDDIARVRAENRQRRAFNALRGLFNSREAREHIERLPIERLEHALELLAPRE